MVSQRGVGAVALALAGLLVGGASPALAATTGNLPGGTSIGVSITGPNQGAVLPQGVATITGTASIGLGVPVVDTALTYVVDASSSTGSPCTTTQTVLGCEVGAARGLNQIAAASRSVVGSVGAVAFGTKAAIADVGPAAGDQRLTGPGTDSNGDGTPDVEEALASIRAGGVDRFTARTFSAGTDYVPALLASNTVTAAQTQKRKIVVFLSDGFSGSNVGAAVAAAGPDVDIYTFAVGAGASCDGVNYASSMQRIADVTGGTCTEVPNPAALPSIVPSVINATLTGLTVSVDNGPQVPITALSVAALPQTGPTQINWTVPTAPLGVGAHRVCVTANGNDGGGDGSVTDCVNVTVQAPPGITPGGPYTTAEGTAVSVGGTLVNPPVGLVTTRWTATPLSGVGAGASCSFADPNALNTTVTCNDNGVWTLTLTANDGVNGPVTGTTTVTVANANPVVSVSTSGAAQAGSAVTVTGTITDPGANDTFTCRIDFGDGTVVNATVTGSTCSAAHAYGAVGQYTVRVTATDDDGGVGTGSTTTAAFARAEAWGLSAAGLITLAKTPYSACPPSTNNSTLSLNVVNLLTVGAVNANCNVDSTTGTTTAFSSVAGGSLLLGAITIGAVSAQCTSTGDGLAGSSTVASINGQIVGTATATINILGVAQIYVNQTVIGADGSLTQYAVRVVTPLGQEIVVAGCRIGF
ncbi:PKD domain-containing protein [Actinosynnema pretiosum subsp. pretiosum]|uniref:PKD domain-containing protein n=1 Tax=Actinosynnema pretiosum subsp. pretiosum TaxID=103721 RepID=A0AA45R6G5_9PSEU|nr:hypothetical protein APASM_1677 [Actinosynnema pretiosum subsp. pretiosum]QUF06678.1 PKD domain-containing protein [Actinosynnema pretiosum subsp. pretiosum]